MDTIRTQNSPLLISIPAPKSPRNSLRSIALLAQKIGGFFASMNVNLDRKRTIVPGMSDRAFAQFSRSEHHEAVTRWNALAHKYGGTRIRQ